MIGTTRSRVSCFTNRFRKRGFVDYGEVAGCCLRAAQAITADTYQEARSSCLNPSVK